MRLMIVVLLGACGADGGTAMTEADACARVSDIVADREWYQSVTGDHRPKCQQALTGSSVAVADCYSFRLATHGAAATVDIDVAATAPSGGRPDVCSMRCSLTEWTDGWQLDRCWTTPAYDP